MSIETIGNHGFLLGTEDLLHIYTEPVGLILIFAFDVSVCGGVA